MNAEQYHKASNTEMISLIQGTVCKLNDQGTNAVIRIDAPRTGNSKPHSFMEQSTLLLFWKGTIRYLRPNFYSLYRVFFGIHFFKLLSIMISKLRGRC